MTSSKNILLTGLISLGALSTSAQAPRHISMDEAIDLGLKNSKQLRVSDARLQGSLAQYKEAKDRRLPDFTISASYLRITHPDIDLKIPLSSSGGNGNETKSAPPVVDQAAYALANASLPLFSGFRIQSGIESAKYLLEASKLDVEKDRDDVIQNLIAAYTNLFKATEAVRVAQEELHQSTERVKDMTNLEKNGLLPRNDLLRFQLQKSNVDLALLDAQAKLNVTNENMNILLGLPDGTVLNVDTVFAYDEQNRNLNEWQSLALQNRRDAAALGYRSKAAEAGIRAAKGEYYPSLAVTGGYIGAWIPNVLTITDAFNAGVGLSYSPSSLWKTGAKVAEAKARSAEVNANIGLLSDGIRLQVTQAYEQYIHDKKSVDVQALAVQQSEENFRIVQNKYNNSLAIATDLVDADLQQFLARLNYSFARADAAMSYKKLLQTSGLLSAEGVVKTIK
jgi:outer membrane protein TolC